MTTRWGFMTRYEIPDYDRPEANYLTRWRLVETPLFAVFLHRMDGPDPRPTLHDHPWRFLSVVVRGGYVETRLDPRTMTTSENTVTRLNAMPLPVAHAILRLLRHPTWTLVFVGRRVREWGFLEPENHDPASGVPRSWRWTAFNLHHHAREFDAALAWRARERAG